MTGRLTREFLNSGFRVYKGQAFVANTSIAAIIAFSFASYLGRENAAFPVQTPKDKQSAHLDQAPTAASPGDPASAKIDRSGFDPARVHSSIDRETNGFAHRDYAGIDRISRQAAKASQGDGYVLPDNARVAFGVPPYNITPAIRDGIERASEATGVPKAVLYAFASKESDFRPAVGNPETSAQGLFQHTDETWRASIKKLGPNYGYQDEARHIGINGRRTYFTDWKAGQRILDMRNNPAHAAMMTAALMLDDQWRVSSKIGRKLAPNEYYVTHFLGSGNAAVFLRALDRRPNARVNSVRSLGDAIRSNRGVFVDRSTGRWKTFRQVMNWVNREMGSRIAYFGLKYGDPSSDVQTFAMDYAKARGLLEKHEGKRVAEAAPKAQADDQDDSYETARMRVK